MTPRILLPSSSTQSQLRTNAGRRHDLVRGVGFKRVLIATFGTERHVNRILKLTRRGDRLQARCHQATDRSLEIRLAPASAFTDWLIPPKKSARSLSGAPASYVPLEHITKYDIRILMDRTLANAVSASLAPTPERQPKESLSNVGSSFDIKLRSVAAAS